MQKYSLLIALAASLVGSSQADPCYRSEEHFIGGRCYQLVSRQLSFEDARYWCHYQNPSTSSYLATVPDQKTANFLASYALTTFGNDNNFWIGLSRNTASSGYRWDSGYPLGWTNFNVQNGGLYVAESAKNAKWSTFGADAKFNFVCSYDPYAPGTTNYPTQDPTETTSTETTTTSSDLPACNPLVPHSLLFGYSNDLDYDYVLEAKNDLIGKLRDFKPNIIKLANIRFDVTTPEEPEFHDDIDSFNSSITYRMPDPKLSFPSITQSSDAMSAALKLLNNGGRAPLCGAIVYLLTKRVSMDKDTISGYLILNHAKLYIIQAPAEYGSLYNSTLLDPVRFSRGLNVYCGDRKGLSYALQTMNILFFQYNAFWDNWGIGGRERFQRVLSNARYQSGVFTTPYLKNRNGLLFFTVQCSGPLENFHNINVSFVDTVRNTEQFAYVVKSDLEPYASNAWFQSIHLESYTRYQVYVDLGSYGGWRDCVDIRINSLSPISYWYDYTNN